MLLVHAGGEVGSPSWIGGMSIESLYLHFAVMPCSDGTPVIWRHGGMA